jgi:hypothetical protein
MRGLVGADADLALYPEGGGSVDLKVWADGVVAVLLQLRFSFIEGDMAIDEICLMDTAQGTVRVPKTLSTQVTRHIRIRGLCRRGGRVCG